MQFRVKTLDKLKVATQTVIATDARAFYLARRACRSDANQKWSELTRLVQLVRQLCPVRVMEIGVDSGATLALWSELADDHADLIGVDVALSADAERKIRSSMRHSQTLHLLRANSHAKDTRQAVLDIIRAGELDFLFIDGDHSYAGVRADWEIYSPLLRQNGIIAFHDIVPDHRVRFGTKTNSDAGGVYRLWNELKKEFPYREFIEDPKQDGYGIGIIRRFAA